MSDVGEIKAKVSIEYDGSGLAAAKEDLASLGELGGSIGESLDSAGESLSNFGESAAESAGKTGDFSDVIASLEEPAKSGEEAISDLTDAVEEHGAAVEEAAQSHENFQEQVAGTAEAIKDVVPATQDATKQLQSMTAQVESSSDGLDDFRQNYSVFQSALSDPEPFKLIADHIDATGQTVDDFASSIGDSNASILNEMAKYSSIEPPVIQAASMGGTLEQQQQAYLEYTDQFNSIGASAAQAEPQVNNLNEATEGVTTSSVGAQSALAKLGPTLAENNATTFEATDAFAGMQTSIVATGKATEDFTGTFTDSLDSISKASNSGGLSGWIEGGGLGGVGEAIGGVMEGLNQVAMPLMAVQMIGMAVGTISQGIYNAAAVAEGSGAHGVNTFTGSIDELAQSSQKAGQAFSEAFGQQLIPNIQAANDIASNSIGSSGGFGALLGGMVSFTATAGSGLIGSLLGAVGMSNNPFTDFANQSMTDMFTYPAGGVNQSPGDIAHAQFVNQIGSTVDMAASNNQNSATQYLTEAATPSYLQSQDQSSAAQQYYAKQQASYDTSHPISQQTEAQDASYNAYVAQQQQNMANAPTYGQIAGGQWSTGNYGGAIGTMLGATGDENALIGSMTSMGPLGDLNDLLGGNMASDAENSGAFNISNPFTGTGGAGGFMEDINKPLLDLSNSIGQLFSGGSTGGGIGGFFGGLGQDFNNLFGGGAAPVEQTSTSGCFPSGTLVLMANGTERSIETLQVGERVLANDGTTQRATTILACISLPPRHVYELLFLDGTTLTLTDSHPISTDDGWKSLSPDATKKENPDLAVTTLQIGDIIHTIYGTTQLIAVQAQDEMVAVYNINVGDPHTFYANDVLVHNKPMSMTAGGSQQVGDQVADQVQGIQLPHLDLSAMASNLGGDFSGIQLPHIDLSGMASNLGGSFGGIQLPHIDLSGMASTLGGSFGGIQLPHLDLSGMAGSLSGAFGGIQLPHIDLSGIASNLSGAFSGISLPSIPNIAGEINSSLSGMFSGFSLPSIPDIAGDINSRIGGMFSGFSLPSIPDIAGDINNTVGNMFSSFSMPSIPNIAGAINSTIGGMFSNFSLPSIPNIAGAINADISGMFAAISIPGFASGVVNNPVGQLAMVGEAGPELMYVPQGASIFPNGTGPSVGDGSPATSILDSNTGGGSAPQSINLVVQIDSQALIQAMGIPMAQSMRVGLGMRGF